MLVTIIRKEQKDEFFHNTIETHLIEKYCLNDVLYRNMKKPKNLFYKKSQIYLFEIKEHEYRKADFLYYSRIHSQRIMGLLQKEFFPLSILFKVDCSKCFQNIESEQRECLTCKSKFEEIEYPFFVNINQFIPYSIYKDIKDSYNLGEQEEFMRDQRTRICDPIKLEIIEKALHPDKIERILELTNDHFQNLDKYI